MNPSSNTGIFIFDFETYGFCWYLFKIAYKCLASKSLSFTFFFVKSFFNAEIEKLILRNFSNPAPSTFFALKIHALNYFNVCIAINWLFPQKQSLIDHSKDNNYNKTQNGETH